MTQFLAFKPLFKWLVSLHKYNSTAFELLNYTHFDLTSNSDRFFKKATQVNYIFETFIPSYIRLPVQWWCSDLSNIPIPRGPGFDSRVDKKNKFLYIQRMFLHAVHLLSFLKRSCLTARGITSPWRAILGWATASRHLAAHNPFACAPNFAH